jgi:hypothetical protein
MANETLTRSRSGRASDAGAHDLTLLGVKRQDWRGRPEAALELGRKLVRRSEIAYWVDSPTSRLPDDKSADRRTGPRHRASLRSAKVLDGSYRFVCDSRICALRLRATLRFRVNSRCMSMKHPKCARRRLSGSADRQLELDCARPRQRTLFGYAIATR